MERSGMNYVKDPFRRPSQNVSLHTLRWPWLILISPTSSIHLGLYFGFLFFFFYIDLSRELQSILESMMSPNPEVRPSARLLLDHPFLRSRRRLRCLRLGLRNTQQWLFTSAIRIFSYLLQLFLMLFFPIRALARKWRKSNYNQPATPVRSLPDKNCGKCINDFSFSDGNFSIHFIFNFQIVI